MRIYGIVNRTSIIFFDNEDDAKSYLSAFPATVGLSIHPIDVVERQTPITKEALEAASGWMKRTINKVNESLTSYVYMLSPGESSLRSLQVIFLPDGSKSISLMYEVCPLPRIKTMEQLNTLVELLGVDDVA